MIRIIIHTGIFIIFLILATCKEKEISKTQDVSPDFKPQALVLFALGEVKVGDRQLKVGDVVLEKESFRTGKKSVCDFQVIGLDTDVTIRIKENSDFSLSGFVSKEGKNLQVQSIVGKILVNAQKLNAKENINLVTPTVMVGVRGTKFEVEAKKNLSSIISVFEGKVAVKVVIPEVYGLPEEIKEKSQTLATLEQYLTEKELVVESGNTSVVTNKYAEKVLKESGIGEILKSADNKNLTEELDKKITSEVFTEKMSKIKDQEIQAPVTKIAKKTFDEKLKEYEEFIAIEKAKLSDPNLKEQELKKRMKSPELMQRIEQIMDQSVEILILKSGERITGVVEQVDGGNKFIVLTPEGKKEYSKEDVLRTAFPE